MRRFEKYNGEKKIDPPLSEVEAAEKELIRFYKADGFTKKEAETKAKTGIEKALYGWIRCPNTFESRIKQIRGRNSSTARKLREEKKVVEAEKVLKKLAKSSSLPERILDLTFINHLDLKAPDKKFVKERKEAYFKDFDFNNSNDEMIVNKIIIDELALRTLEKKRFEDLAKIDEDLEKTVDIIQKRLKVNIDSLGISRKLRVEQDMNIEGNVASLSVHLDKKMSEIKNLRDPDLKEELMNGYLDGIVGVSADDIELLIEEIQFLQKHDAYPEKNPLPEQDLLEEEAKKSVSDLESVIGKV